MDVGIPVVEQMEKSYSLNAVSAGVPNSERVYMYSS